MAPDLGRPDEPPETVTREAYASGHYKVDEGQAPSGADGVVHAAEHEPPPEPVAAPPAASAPQDDAEPPETETAADEAPAASQVVVIADRDGLAPTPSHLIRMVPLDPTTSADGYQRDETGAYLVPLAQIEALKSHGFKVEHLHERPEA